MVIQAQTNDHPVVLHDIHKGVKESIEWSKVHFPKAVHRQ